MKNGDWKTIKLLGPYGCLLGRREVHYWLTPPVMLLCCCYWLTSNSKQLIFGRSGCWWRSSWWRYFRRSSHWRRYFRRYRNESRSWQDVCRFRYWPIQRSDIHCNWLSELKSREKIVKFKIQQSYQRVFSNLTSIDHFLFTAGTDEE